MVLSISKKGFQVLFVAVWLPVLMVFPLTGAAMEGKGENGACRADFEKYCKDVKPGEGRILQCMKQHEKDLSEGCKAQMAERKEIRERKREENREACKGDVEKFCRDIKPGGGRIVQCLAEHKDQLSELCRQHLPPKSPAAQGQPGTGMNGDPDGMMKGMENK